MTDSVKHIDVIVPTFCPDERLAALVKKLESQTVRPDNIWIINTLTDNSDKKNLPNPNDFVHVLNIGQYEFDHGATRNLGASKSTADYLLFMTQDAVPEDYTLIENLLKKFDNDNVAVAYARQIAYEDDGLIERLTREFNYPDKDLTKTFSTKKVLGIKSCFCSNVCAMYDRSLFFSLGQFPKNMIFNEDMIFASKVINAKLVIEYASKAVVRHSHNYPLSKLFRRHFDLSVSQTQNKALFAEFSSNKEGVKFVKYVLRELWSRKEFFLCIKFIVQSAVKFAGHQTGKLYRILPLSVVVKLSLNKNFWRNNLRQLL